MSCSLCEKLSAYMWANQSEIMRYNHSKPAPCISHTTLLYIRLVLSAILLLAIVFEIIVTGGTSFMYLSQWSLILANITFLQLAYAQIKSQKVSKEGLIIDEDA